MRALLLALLLSGVACPALATDWVLLAAHDDESVALFYDPHSVRVSGDIVHVRVKRVFSWQEGRDLGGEHGFSGPVAYSVEQVVLDCAAERLTRRSAVWVGVGGKMLDRTAPSSGNRWIRMHPGGFGRALCDELD